MHRLCYSDNYNDHIAYPRSLISAPPLGYKFRPTEVSFSSLGRPWAFYDVRPGEIIHASSLIPLNRNVPWIFDTDHILYLLIQMGVDSSEDPEKCRQIERKILIDLTSPDLIGVMTWSIASRTDLLMRYQEHQIEPPPILCVYPTVIPPPRENISLSGTTSVLMDQLRPNSIKLLQIDGQRGICRTPGRKNIAAGITCFQRLAAKGLDVEMIIVNPSHKFPGYPGVHTLQEFISREELWVLYQTADILLFLSHQDSFGYVILEAMYNGMCCIVSSAPSVVAASELVKHGDTGFTVEYRTPRPYPEFSTNLDIDNLEFIIERLIYSPSLRRKIGERAKSQFTMDGKFNLTDRNKIYDDILKL